jgi:hypothetical protein
MSIENTFFKNLEEKEWVDIGIDNALRELTSHLRDYKQYAPREEFSARIEEIIIWIKELETE